MLIKLAAVILTEALSFNDLNSHLRCYRTCGDVKNHYDKKSGQNIAFATIWHTFDSRKQFRWFQDSKLCHNVCSRILISDHNINKLFLKHLNNFKHLTTLEFYVHVPDPEIQKYLSLEIWDSAILEKLTSLTIANSRNTRNKSESIVQFIAACKNLTVLKLINVELNSQSKLTNELLSEISFDNCVVLGVQNFSQSKSIKKLDVKASIDSSYLQQFQNLTHFKCHVITQSILDCLPKTLLSLEFRTHCYQRILFNNTLIQFSQLKSLSFSLLEDGNSFQDVLRFFPPSLTHICCFNGHSYHQTKGETFFLREVDSNVYTIHNEHGGYIMIADDFRPRIAKARDTSFDPRFHWEIQSIDGNETTIVNVASKLSIYPSETTFKITQINKKYVHCYIELLSGEVLKGFNDFVGHCPKTENRYVAYQDFGFYLQKPTRKAFDSLPNLRECKFYCNNDILVYYRNGRYDQI